MSAAAVAFAPAPEPVSLFLARPSSMPSIAALELLQLGHQLVIAAKGMLGLADDAYRAGNRELAVQCLGQALELARLAGRVRRIAGHRRI